MKTKSSHKPILILIQSTDSPIHEHLEKGIWTRQEFTLSQYAKACDVYYYTCDSKNFQNIMPDGVIHKTGKITSGIFGLRHFLYYIFLLLSSDKWRKWENAIVRVIGVNVPVIPMLKKISKKYFIISYQFDWAYGMKKDYRGIKPMVSGAVQRWVINSADHLICTTQWLANIAKERYHKNKITIIPNYVNTEIFKPTFPKKKQIVFAGRLHWSKGIDVLINAFGEFSKTYPDYKLTIIGIGEEEKKLKKMSDGKPIVFTGAIANTEVACILNESEIFVLPTINMEGHPKVLVEAMASGCKCITSNVPGNNHVLIESNSKDLLFTTKDADDLYHKLIYATQIKTDNQYHYAIENYSANICFNKEIDILTRRR
ncbi:MAG: glycosyltransferase family 4 protein [Bacteroidota bacterium]